MDSDLRAELVRADPLKLSTLLLGIPVNGAFGAKLLFGESDPAVVAYLEVYGAVAGQVAASIDLLPSPEGTAIASVPATITASKTGDLRVAYGGFTIRALQPGDYVVRMSVALDGQRVGQVIRTMRKEGGVRR